MGLEFGPDQVLIGDMTVVVDFCGCKQEISEEINPFG